MCPICGPRCRHAYNRKRTVLRIWIEDDNFGSYTCQRCGISGWARDDATGTKKRERTAAAPQRVDVDTVEREELAAMLWGRGKPIGGTLVEKYLRSRQCFIDSPSLRFLPAKGEHPPAMIARFGEGGITGVHLTKLANDGHGKANIEKPKIMLGPSQGQAILVYDSTERDELVITEGIEDAASYALVMGWSAWAAGSSGRIPNIVEQAGRFGRLFLAVDNDFRGVNYEIDGGLKALEKGRLIRPDLTPINIARQFKGVLEKLDANKVLMRYGPEVLGMCVERAMIQDDFARGLLSFGAYQRALERITLPDQDQQAGP